MFRKLLVPTDGSEVSIKGAMRAIPLAKLMGASMKVLFVQDSYPLIGFGESLSAGVQALMMAARENGTQAVSRIRDAAKSNGVVVDTLEVEDRDAAQSIVDTAKGSEADLIVMGSNGRSGVAKMVLGSVATKVLALSPIPVLIIK